MNQAPSASPWIDLLERNNAMNKLMLIALSTVAMGVQAADDKKFYAGGGLSNWKIEAPELGASTFNTTALEAIGGYRILPWLSAEGRLGFGLEREQHTSFVQRTPIVELQAERDRTTAETELNYYASIYIKPEIANDTAALYGLFGLTTYDISADVQNAVVDTTYVVVEVEQNGETVEIEVPGFNSTQDGTTVESEFSDSEFGMTVGVGVSFFFNDITVNAEWKNYLLNNSDSDTTASGISGNVTYSF